MAFNLVSNLNEVEYRNMKVVSQAYTIGDAVMWSPGDTTTDVLPATLSSTSANIVAVAMETVTSAATSLLVAIVEPSQKWSCAVTNTVSGNHNGHLMVLTDKATVNNTGTTSTQDEAVVRQVGVSGTLGVFQFVQNGYAPDLA